jgi:hypothetical protein
MSVNMQDPIKVRAWEKTFKKQMILNSQWEQLSNRTISTYELPNASEKKVPETVIHYVSSKFGDGVEYVTIPTMDKLRKKGVGGSQAAQGTEESPKLRFARAYYNLRRKAVTFRNDSVDGDLTKAYAIENQKVPLLKTYFSELNDYDKSLSLCTGADEFLTEDEYWTGDSITAAPVKKALHPNARYAGGTSAVTWSATAATYMGNLVTALNTAFTDATTKMTKAVLIRMISYAQANLAPVASGGYKHVILLSKRQAGQLTSDTDATGWLTTFTNAAERGMANKAISGVIGIFQETLILVNTRAPLFNCETGAAFTGTWDERFQYVKPWDEVGNTNWDAGDNRVPIVKGAAEDSWGTCEVAMILGAGAIGGAKVSGLKFRSENMDYNFSNGFLGYQKEGCVRMDVFDPTYYSSGVSSVKPWNWSSALYFTPTPSEVQ